MLPGTYLNKKKDGSPLYRSSITYSGKHISLGSFPSEEAAHLAYTEAGRLLTGGTGAQLLLDSYEKKQNALPFEKWVVLLNFRDNGIYIKTPIYLEKRYFTYYYSKSYRLKFDVDDLFYYSHHKIMKRGSHLFVADYGMQVNILSRYGIKNYAVAGRDYLFVNGDPTDYRYGNIEIINRYHGVTRQVIRGKEVFTTHILVNGRLLVGRYASEREAAVAYNRAAALLKAQGVKKQFPQNYIEGLDEIEYVSLFNRVRISSGIRAFGQSAHTKRKQY